MAHVVEYSQLVQSEVHDQNIERNEPVKRIAHLFAIYVQRPFIDEDRPFVSKINRVLLLVLPVLDR